MIPQGEEAVLERLKELHASVAEIRQRVTLLRSELSQSRTEVEARLRGVQDSIVRKLPLLDLTHINQVVQELAVGKRQEQILEVYLRGGHEYVNRALLFLEKEGQYVPWKGIGFSAESIELVTAEEEEDPIIRAAQQKRIIYRTEAVGEAFPWLRGAGELPESVICVPLAFEDYVPVVFYGDSLQPIAIDPLELLTHLTGLILKNHYLQNQTVRQPSESGEGLVEELEKVVEQMASVAPTQFLQKVQEPPEREEEKEKAAVTPSESGEGLVEELERVVEQMASVAPTQFQQKVQEPPETKEEKEKAAVTSVDTEPAKSEEAAPRQGERPSEGEQEEINVKDFQEILEKMASVTPAQFQQPEPAEPKVESETSEGMADEKKRYHDEAWRLARRLVNEIKLLNSEEVATGQRSKDLYKRLKGKIEKNRQEYDRQVHRSAAAQIDYFHQELVEILADGDETLLGREYPGPTGH